MYLRVCSNTLPAKSGLLMVPITSNIITITAGINTGMSIVELPPRRESDILHFLIMALFSLAYQPELRFTHCRTIDLLGVFLWWSKQSLHFLSSAQRHSPPIIRA